MHRVSTATSGQKKKKATAERPALEVRPTHAEDPGSLLKLTDHFEVLTEKKKKKKKGVHGIICSGRSLEKTSRIVTKKIPFLLKKGSSWW